MDTGKRRNTPLNPDLEGLSRVEIRPAGEKNKHNLVLIGVDKRPTVVGMDLRFHEARAKASKLASRYNCAILNVG